MDQCFLGGLCNTFFYKYQNKTLFWICRRLNTRIEWYSVALAIILPTIISNFFLSFFFFLLSPSPLPIPPSVLSTSHVLKIMTGFYKQVTFTYVSGYELEYLYLRNFLWNCWSLASVLYFSDQTFIFKSYNIKDRIWSIFCHLKLLVCSNFGINKLQHFFFTLTLKLK